VKTAPDKIFDGLNDKQIEAVRAINGPVLILAETIASRAGLRDCGCLIFAVNVVK